MMKNFIYVDISELYHNDHKTGIQRVVRSILAEFKIMDSIKDNVVPVCWNNRNEYLAVENNKLKNPIRPKKNDIFLGLDLADGVIHATNSGLFNIWKGKGVYFYFIVYDLLPLYNKQWWPDGVFNHHYQWINALVKTADCLICISNTVKDDVNKWIIINKPHLYKLIDVTFFHLGADINNSVPTKGIPVESEIVFKSISKRPTFLMVGTIEPRKGHNYVLNAFEMLWNNTDINLVIVGKEGWMMNTFIEKLISHEEYNKRLFWLNSISDEYLMRIYSLSTCLIAASEAEGFGLPLIEAAKNKIPIISRDIPVFREVAGDFAFYFKNSTEPSSLIEALNEWLVLYRNNHHPISENLPSLSWKESANCLANIILKNKD